MRVAFLIVALSFIQLTSSLAQITKIAGGFHNIVSLKATANNTLIVAESETNRIIRLDYNGNRIDSLGGLGAGMYQFDGLVDLDATNGLKLFVADRYNQRIQIYDRRLQYLSSIQRTETRSGSLVFEPEAIAVDRMDQAYFFDHLTKTIFRFNYRGEFDRQIYTREIDEEIRDVKLKIIDNILSISGKGSNIVYNYTIDGKFINFIQFDDPILDFVRTENGYAYVDSKSVKVVDKSGKSVSVSLFGKSLKSGTLAVSGSVIFVSDGSSMYKLALKSQR